MNEEASCCFIINYLTNGKNSYMGTQKEMSLSHNTQTQSELTKNVLLNSKISELVSSESEY